jgi:hypothetical protein
MMIIFVIFRMDGDSKRVGIGEVLFDLNAALIQSEPSTTLVAVPEVRAEPVVQIDDEFVLHRYVGKYHYCYAQ